MRRFIYLLTVFIASALSIEYETIPKDCITDRGITIVIIYKNKRYSSSHSSPYVCRCSQTRIEKVNDKAQNCKAAFALPENWKVTPEDFVKVEVKGEHTCRIKVKVPKQDVSKKTTAVAVVYGNKRYYETNISKNKTKIVCFCTRTSLQKDKSFCSASIIIPIDWEQSSSNYIDGFLRGAHTCRGKEKVQWPSDVLARNDCVIMFPEDNTTVFGICVICGYPAIASLFNGEKRKTTLELLKELNTHKLDLHTNNGSNEIKFANCPFCDVENLSTELKEQNAAQRAWSFALQQGDKKWSAYTSHVYAECEKHFLNRGKHFLLSMNDHLRNMYVHNLVQCPFCSQTGTRFRDHNFLCKKYQPKKGIQFKQKCPVENCNEELTGIQETSLHDLLHFHYVRLFILCILTEIL